MSSLPITPPRARVDVAPKSAGPPPPSGSAGLGDFAALLTQTTSARTAPAEGQKTSRPAADDRPVRRRDEAKDDNKDAQASTATATPASDAAPAQAAAGAADADGKGAQGQPAAGQDAQAPAPPTDTQPGAAGAVAAVPTVPTTAAGQPGTPAPGTPGPGQGQGAQAGATAQNAALVLPLDARAAPADPNAAAADAAAGKLQIPAGLLAGKATNKLGHVAKDLNNDTGGLPPAPTLPPSTTTGATAPAAAGAGDTPNGNGAQPQAQPQVPTPTVAATPATPTPQGVFATANGGAPQLARASVLQTADRVQELVRIATTRSGNARATLQLKPEALGQVDVQLRTTRDGLVATIAAHDKAGLDALQNAAGDLRRVLEDRGVELHSLDLQLSGGDAGFTNQGDAGQASTGRGTASSYDLDDGDDAATEDDLTITTPTSMPAGALVDVTA